MSCVYCGAASTTPGTFCGSCNRYNRASGAPPALENVQPAGQEREALKKPPSVDQRALLLLVVLGIGILAFWVYSILPRSPAAPNPAASIRQPEKIDAYTACLDFARQR